VLSLSFFSLLVLPTLTPSLPFFRFFLLIFIFLPFPCQFPLPLVFPLGFCFFSLPFFFFVNLNVAQLIENSGYVLYTNAIANLKQTQEVHTSLGRPLILAALAFFLALLQCAFQQFFALCKEQ
jgi:hypothetical protein